jgi:hypothetical protein
MCGLHHAQGNEEHGFLGLASKPRSSVSPNLASKPVATVLLVWPQNHSCGFPGLGLKPGNCGLVIWAIKSARRFLGLGLKTKWVMVCRLLHKTDGGDEYGMGHVSRCNGLLRLEATQARVSQSSIKTGGDATWMVHVASSWRLCGDKAEDERVNVTGCIGFFYPNFVVFVVLAHKDSLVISFPKNRTLRAGREVSISTIPLPPPSYSCFLIGVDMLHVLEERGEK